MDVIHFDQVVRHEGPGVDFQNLGDEPTIPSRLQNHEAIADGKTGCGWGVHRGIVGALNPAGKPENRSMYETAHGFETSWRILASVPIPSFQYLGHPLSEVTLSPVAPFY